MQYLTLADKPITEQFAYWREVICQVCTPLAAEREPVDRGGYPAGGMTGWVRSSTVGSTHLAQVCSASQSLEHGVDEIRRMASDDVFVALQLRGHCVAVQGDRTCRIPPGGFAMFDTARTYRLSYSGDAADGEWQVLSLRVPRARLLPLVEAPDSFTAVTHDATGGGIASLVASTMTATWRNADSLKEGAALSAEAALLTLLAAVAGDTADQRGTRRSALDSALRASISRYVRANVHRGELSAGAVARTFAISVRKLHALYENSDHTFAQTVMSARLEACAADLAGGAGARTLTETAARWGFADLSHMNRVFRARYGCLPSEYRAGRI